MSLVQGNFISFNPSIKVAKKDGGQFDAWELVFRNRKNEVDSIKKPAGGLQYNPALKAVLTTLSAGEPFTVLMEKNEKGYLDVKSIEKGHSETQSMLPSVMSSSDGNRQAARSGRVLGSTYETSEERAKKQVIITRQASVNAAIAFLSPSLKDKPSADDVAELLGMASVFEKHYNKDLDKAAKKYMALDLSKGE
jgi:cell division protein YceG involved in septum cleavage